jgi:hypothetical protein
VKTVLLLSLALLAGCAKPPSATSSPETTPTLNLSPNSAGYIFVQEDNLVGNATEADLLAKRGQPLDKLTSSDGSTIYVYYAMAFKASRLRPVLDPNTEGLGPPIQMDGRDGMMPLKVHYFFSRDGILRNIELATPQLDQH